MEKKCAIFCFENLDGITAAAIVARWARMGNYNYKIDFINYQSVDEAFDKMALLSKHIIFILDFSPQEIKDLGRKISKVEAAKNKIVYWNTHIPITPDVSATLKKHVKLVDVDTRMCAAEHVWQRFSKNDRIAVELKNIAHDLEFWKKEDERSTKIADLIASGFNRHELIEALSKGIFWSDRYEELRNEYLEKKAHALEELNKNLVEFKYNGVHFGITLAPSILSTADAGQKVLDDSSVDVALVVYRDGKLSFRRRDGNEVDVSEIAKVFDGGGHPYAAGGKLEKSYFVPIRSGQNFKTAVGFVDKKLKEYFTN